jgi:iron complex transport system substrate-binding protein
LSRHGGPLNRVLYRDQSLDRPSDLLADLVAILHPDRLPDHQFTFIQRLP